MNQNSGSRDLGVDAQSESALLDRLGQGLARERLRRNLTQTELAVEAGVSRATVSRLEGGESTQLTNLVRVLRALGLAENLEALAPAPTVRPLEQAQHEGRVRRRASTKPRGDERTDPPARGSRAQPWTWGEDR